jgi:hypothetical protein
MGGSIRITSTVPIYRVEFFGRELAEETSSPTSPGVVLTACGANIQQPDPLAKVKQVFEALDGAFTP